MGKFADGGYGIRCSDSTYDASTNPVDQTKLSFSSDWGVVAPRYLSGTSINIANNSTVIIYFTSLGYIPFSNCMFRVNGTTDFRSLTAPYNFGNVVILCAVYVDHIKIINRYGAAIDVAYTLLKVRTH